MVTILGALRVSSISSIAFVESLWGCRLLWKGKTCTQCTYLSFSWKASLRPIHLCCNGVNCAMGYMSTGAGVDDLYGIGALQVRIAPQMIQVHQGSISTPELDDMLLTSADQAAELLL
ncbi:hypothetical protein ABBQ32_012411 [Trebouxia sp. C0010 RCD-2024]